MYPKHQFSMAPFVNSWHGTVLDLTCIEKLKHGDIVRVYVGNSAPYYIIMKFRGKCCIGIRYDVYMSGWFNFKCNYCNREFSYGETVYSCNGNVGDIYHPNDCDSHICINCFNRNDKICPKKNNCKISPDKIERKYPPRILKFPKWAITEIPPWSKNTENFEEIYGTEKCRVVTGMSFEKLVSHFV